MSDNFNTTLRKMAKSHYWQTLYISSKEFGFKLFENDKDLTDVQIQFLNWLGFYYSLFMDINYGEISERVLNHFVLEDAYTTHKKNKDKVVKNNKKTQESNSNDNKNSKNMTVSWRPKNK